MQPLFIASQTFMERGSYSYSLTCVHQSYLGCHSSAEQKASFEAKKSVLVGSALVISHPLQGNYELHTITPTQGHRNPGLISQAISSYNNNSGAGK